jgi:hypothetical protein
MELLTAVLDAPEGRVVGIVTEEVRGTPELVEDELAVYAKQFEQGYTSYSVSQ